MSALIILALSAVLCGVLMRANVLRKRRIAEIPDRDKTVIENVRRLRVNR